MTPPEALALTGITHAFGGHRALDDARVCAQLLRVCAERLEPDRLDKHGRGKGFEAYRPRMEW